MSVFNLIAALHATVVPLSAQTNNEHFQITLAVIAVVTAALGWFVKRIVQNSDNRYTTLVTELHETNIKLAGVAEGLAQVVGQLKSASEQSVITAAQVASDTAAAAAKVARDAVQAAAHLAEVNRNKGWEPGTLRSSEDRSH